MEPVTASSVLYVGYHVAKEHGIRATAAPEQIAYTTAALTQR